MIIKYIKLNILGKLIPMLSAFFSIPYLVNGLGAELFGILIIFWAIVGYSSMLDIGISKSIIKKVSELNGKDNILRVTFYFWNAIGAQFLVGILISSIILLNTNNIISIINPQALSLNNLELTVWLVAFCIPLIQVVGTFRGYVEGVEDFVFFNLVRIPLSSLMYILPTIFVIFTSNIFYLVIILLALRLIELVIFALYVFKKNHFLININFNLNRFKEIFNYGSWVMVSNIIVSFFLILEKFILASMITVAAVTYYFIPQEIIFRLTIFAGVISMSIFPYISRISIKENDKKLTTLISNIFYELIFYYGIFFIISIFFGNLILSIWIGDEISEKSTYIFHVMSLGLIVNALSFIALAVLQGNNMPKIPALGYLVQLPVYIVLLIFLINQYGLVGAAYAWFIRVLLDAVYLYYMIHKKVISNIIKLDIKLILRIVTIFVCAILLKFILEIYLEEMYLFVVYLSIVGFMVYLYYLNRKTILKTL